MGTSSQFRKTLFKKNWLTFTLICWYIKTQRKTSCGFMQTSGYEYCIDKSCESMQNSCLWGLLLLIYQEKHAVHKCKLRGARFSRGCSCWYTWKTSWGSISHTKLEDFNKSAKDNTYNPKTAKFCLLKRVKKFLFNSNYAP